MKVEAKVWAVCQGKVTKLKYDGKIFVNNGYNREGSGRIPVLEKWIIDEGVEEFTTKEFFDAFPKQKKHPAQYAKVVSDLIKKDRIQQLSNDKFKVIN